MMQSRRSRAREIACTVWRTLLAAKPLPAAMLIALVSSTAIAADDGSSLAEILQRAVTESGAPGAGGVVTSSDGIIDLAVAGVRRADRDSALEADDPFHIGSVTKPLTATVLARLVESKPLDWDTPVAKVLPDVMNSALPAYDGITLAHLLAHEAGMQPMEEDAEFDTMPEFTSDLVAQRRQFARWVLQQEPIVTPMEEYRYSNAHFIVAAAMAEAVSGQTWEALIEEHIFDEFGMASAGFGWPGRGGEPAPWGHAFVDGKFKPVDPNGSYQLPRFFAPAGDVYASLPDMARFFRAILKSWRGTDDYLARKTLERMLTRRLRSGLGWGVTSAFGFDRVATYSGSADTFLMIVALVPDENLAVAVVANAYSENVQRALVQALRDIVGRRADGPATSGS